MDLNPGSGRSPGGGHGNPLQYFCLENPMNRGACQAAVHRVTKSQTWLKWLSMQRLRALNKYIPEEYVKAFYLHNEIFWCDKDKHPKLTQKIAWQRRERRLVWLFWWLVAEVGVKKGKRESKVCKLSADKYKRSQTLCSLLKVYLALFGCI